MNPYYVSRRWRAIAALPILGLLSSCQGVLDPHGPIGRDERTLLIDATAIMLAVVVPVIALTLSFAWWFRAGNSRARYLPTWEYSGRIEMIVWSIPALIIMFLGGMAWISSHELDPPYGLHVAADADVLEVDVVSLDWKWLFLYPTQGVGSVNRLVIPVGKPVHFRLTSATVMNSFFIPNLGSQIYTMPGMTTQLELQANDAGHYAGRSAQFSGDGFADMVFDVQAVPVDEFDGWVAAAKKNGATLDQAGYTLLAQPSSTVAPTDYAAFDSALFNLISMGHAPVDGLPVENR